MLREAPMARTFILVVTNAYEELKTLAEERRVRPTGHGPLVFNIDNHRVNSAVFRVKFIIKVLAIGYVSVAKIWYLGHSIGEGRDKGPLTA